MLEQVKAAMLKMEHAIESIASIEGILSQAVNYENFALIQRDGSFHFVLLTAAQAAQINGLSIPLIGLHDIVPKVKEMLLGGLNQTLQAHKDTLKPLVPAGSPELKPSVVPSPVTPVSTPAASTPAPTTVKPTA